MRRFLLAAASAALSCCAAPPNLNVLYILSDDMRADLGSYELPAVTPNLDALAASSVRFTHSFCQLSVCSPSRQSFLTGRRPDRSQVWNFLDSNPLNASAIPGHFRDNGYLTLGLGKTFHEDGGAWNADAFWSLDPATDGLPYFPYEDNECPNGGEGGGHCAVPDGDAGESKIFDYRLLNSTLQYLAHAANVRRLTGRPFFLMTGFRDPHAPWAAPQRMYDLYNESEIAVAASPLLGEGTPLIAWSDQLNVELANGTSFPFSPHKAVPDWVARDQRHAYYAAISYVDEHVGKILAMLEGYGLADSTIVVFHADHGYGLGEHGCKFTLREHSTMSTSTHPPATL
jgi:iduronate 2-sulfatase